MSCLFRLQTLIHCGFFLFLSIFSLIFISLVLFDLHFSCSIWIFISFCRFVSFLLSEYYNDIPMMAEDILIVDSGINIIIVP